MMEIDLVVPMVFPQDGEWQREYVRCFGEVAAATNVRFRSWGTEELLVRCCMKYMPWLNNIYLLLAGEGQVQEWMRDLTENREERRLRREGRWPGLRIVFHRDFIPGEYLPCFTSSCIEMFLHRIPGLSEHFIYANDDMFPLSPLAPDDFFRDGLPCQRLVEKPYPAKPNLFERGCMQGLNMIAGPFGKHYTATMLRNGHSIAAYLKSSCEEVWRRHGQEILHGLNPRKRDEHSNYQYIYGYYQQLAGLYVEHTPRLQYVGASTPTKQIATIIRDPQAGIVCLNDNKRIVDWRERAEVVRQSVAAKLDCP